MRDINEDGTVIWTISLLYFLALSLRINAIKLRPSNNHLIQEITSCNLFDFRHSYINANQSHNQN